MQSASAMSEGVRRVLTTLGLIERHDVEFELDSSPGRVSIVHGTTADVVWCDASGREFSSTLAFATNLDLTPVAGDWVSVRDATIIAVSPRRNVLRRPGRRRSQVQVLAANLDVVLVVVAIDRGLNLLMLERLAVMAFDSAATPVIVLSKSDGSEVVDDVRAQVERSVPGVDILTTSSTSGYGIDELTRRLHEGVTAVMLGASGAGKTSLLNAIERTSEYTRTVSRGGEGRHATTTRRLYRLSSGGVLLDIPGIRLLDLNVDRARVGEAFADIVELTQGCQFSDCRHNGDLGCNVERAIKEGRLPARRLQSWRAVVGLSSETSATVRRTRRKSD